MSREPIITPLEFITSHAPVRAGAVGGNRGSTSFIVETNVETAGIEPTARRKQNLQQVALLPANALISHRLVPPLRPVSSRLVPFNSPLEGHTGDTCGPQLFTGRHP
jgi:hypothetical protein